MVYGASPENVSKADALITADLKRMQSMPLAASRLQVAKALLLGQLATQDESYSQIAGRFLAAAREGLPLDEDVLEAHSELAATPKQVQAAMTRWVRPNGFAQVIEGPAPH